MLRRVPRTAHFVALPALASLWIGGCSGGQDGLPSTVTMDLPDGTQVQATMNSGVISFADSRWQFYRTASGTGQGLPFVIIRFGAGGELAAFESSTLASDIFGSEILFDGKRHDTTQQGLQYAAATYGAQTADARGFAFEGRLTAFVAVLGEAANATAHAIGEFAGDDLNTVRGTFEFESHVTLNAFGVVPDEYVDMAESFEFIGHRIVE